MGEETYKEKRSRLRRKGWEIGFRQLWINIVSFLLTTLLVISYGVLIALYLIIFARIWMLIYILIH